MINVGRERVSTCIVVLLVGFSSFYSVINSFNFLALFTYTLTLISSVMYLKVRTQISPLLSTAPDMVVIWFLLAFHAKYIYWVVIPDHMGNYLGDSGYTIEESGLSIAYAYAVMFFLAFTLLSIFSLLLLKARTKNGQCFKSIKFYRSSKGNDLFFFSIGLVFLYIMFILGFAKMGAEKVNLPKGVAGGLFYFTQIIIPFLLFKSYTSKLLHYKNFIFILSLIFIFAICDALVRGSKSSIVFSIVQLIIIYVFSKEIKFSTLFWRNKKLILLLPFFLFVFYAMTMFRIAVLTTESELSASDIANASQEVNQSPVDMIINRAIGLPQLAKILEYKESTYVEFDTFYDKSTANVFTRDIVKHPAKNHSSSPGYIGANLLLFDRGYVVIGAGMLLAFTIVPCLILYFLNCNMGTVIVVQSFVVVNALLLFSEGTISEAFLRMIIVMLIAIFTDKILLFKRICK